MLLITLDQNIGLQIKMLEYPTISQTILRKMCPYLELFSYLFSAFGLNTERYSVYTENNSEYGHFSRDAIIHKCVLSCRFESKV